MYKIIQRCTVIYTHARARASNEICVNLYYSAGTTGKPLITFHYTPQFPYIRPTNDASYPVLSGAQLSQKSRDHLKILDARSTFHTEDPEMLVATMQNLVATATWRLGFMPPPCLNFTRRTVKSVASCKRASGVVNPLIMTVPGC